MKLVLASSNGGKLAELRALLGAGFDLHVQSEFGVADADETGLSFVENAILKARHAAAATGLPSLGDDSGLCVDALQGAPGLHSARYSGTHSNSEANIDRLLRELDGVDDTRRNARFVCVLALVRHADDPQPLIAEGEWHGEIAQEERGGGGFGYDPLFWLPQFGRMSAELKAEEKAKISHRAQAMKILLQKLKLE